MDILHQETCQKLGKILLTVLLNYLGYNKMEFEVFFKIQNYFLLFVFLCVLREEMILY